MYYFLLFLLSSLITGGYCAKCMTSEDARYITPVMEVPESWKNKGWHDGNFFPPPMADTRSNRPLAMLLTTAAKGALIWWLKDSESDLYMILTENQANFLCTLSGAGLQVGWQPISSEAKQSGYCHWDVTIHPEDPSVFQLRNAELRTSIPDIGPVFLNETGLYFDYGSSSENDPVNRVDDILTWWRWSNVIGQDDMVSLPDQCTMGASGIPVFMEEHDMRLELMGRSLGGRRRRRSRFTFSSEDKFARCGNRWYLHNRKCYRIYTAPGLSQSRTSKVCTILEGKIVQPMNLEENAYVRALIHRHAPGREYWLGPMIPDTSSSSISISDFQGSAKHRVRFARWRRQRLLPNQRCVLFTRRGQWKPSSCDVLSGRVLCERDAEIRELPGSSICGKIQERSVDMLMNLASRPEAETRIVGGNDARSTQFPWQAAIRFKKAIKTKGLKIYHNCGGAVIDNCWVLSAAHCFLHDNNKDSYTVRLGDFRKTLNDGTEQEFNIDQLIIHEQYDSFPSHRRDITLIKLQKNARALCATFNNYVQPVCLPTTDFQIADEGELCQVSGWGVTDPSQGQRSAAETLQWVSVPTIGNALCAKRYNENKYNKTYFLPEVMFCAGHKEGRKDSCSGDSGGPYVCRGRSGRYALAGIVSFGIGCARKIYPGVYTRVTHFMPWIVEKVRVYGDGNIIG